jgi:hypothetical protein
VSQTPGGYYQQPQGQPPWDNYPPTSYPQAAPPGTQPFGYGPPKGPPPRRPRRKRPRKRNVILLGIAVFLLIGVIANSASNNKSTKTKATAANESTAAKASARAKASSGLSRRSSARAKTLAARAIACDDRSPASGDIYVRMVTPGTPSQAQQLGGEWRWDYVTNKCLTSVQLTMATAPRSAGNCTQVGYVSDNPGYDLNATVAPRLTDVAAQTGPACKAEPPAAAAPAPAVATSAPAVAASAPVAPTTPAGCYPLSDEGTCYEPGEYCRDDDHGMSGVAGDGESIVCEDNDGWRWEPE